MPDRLLFASTHSYFDRSSGAVLAGDRGALPETLGNAWLPPSNVHTCDRHRTLLHVRSGPFLISPTTLLPAFRTLTA